MLSGDDLTELRALIAQHPDWHRTALSRHLCELWNWRTLTYWLEQTGHWHFVFPQGRTLQRAIALAFGLLCDVGRRTLTRAIVFQGNTQKDSSADYKLRFGTNTR
jgi:hypothetical protein